MTNKPINSQKKYINRFACPHCNKVSDISMFANHFIERGKQEARKEELKWLKNNYDEFDDLFCIKENAWRNRIGELKSQLTKGDVHSQESPRVEKQDEMPDYETANGVTTGTRIQTTIDNLSIHPDSFHGPSQQISVDKREIDVIKQISNVGENPTLDTSYLDGYAEYKDDDEVKKC